MSTLLSVWEIRVTHAWRSTLRTKKRSPQVQMLSFLPCADLNPSQDTSVRTWSSLHVVVGKIPLLCRLRFAKESRSLPSSHRRPLRHPSHLSDQVESLALRRAVPRPMDRAPAPVVRPPEAPAQTRVPLQVPIRLLHLVSIRHLSHQQLPARSQVEHPVRAPQLNPLLIQVLHRALSRLFRRHLTPALRQVVCRQDHRQTVPHRLRQQAHLDLHLHSPVSHRASLPVLSPVLWVLPLPVLPRRELRQTLPWLQKIQHIPQ